MNSESRSMHHKKHFLTTLTGPQLTFLASFFATVLIEDLDLEEKNLLANFISALGGAIRDIVVHDDLVAIFERNKKKAQESTNAS